MVVVLNDAGPRCRRRRRRWVEPHHGSMVVVRLMVQGRCSTAAPVLLEGILPVVRGRRCGSMNVVVVVAAAGVVVVVAVELVVTAVGPARRAGLPTT